MGGVLGLNYREHNCIGDLQDGIFQLQHRGQEHCGFATVGNRLHCECYPGLVSVNTNAEQLEKFPGKSGLAHVSLSDPQPLILESRLGKMALVFDGVINNAREIKQELLQQGCAFAYGTDGEIMARLISQGKDIVDGLAGLPDRIRGAYSLLVLTEKGQLFAMRCPAGIRPLVIGINDAGTCAASESGTLDWLGVKEFKDVEPGAIYELKTSGFAKVAERPAQKIAHCAFEYAYMARIDAIIDGVPVSQARNNFGSALAARDQSVNADVVAGVPMSGLGHALGYHLASQVPYGIVFDYNRYAHGRSYIPPTQTERKRIATSKLYIVKEAVKGKRIVLCDDSIVRGTQIAHRVDELMNAGAREVHVRIGAPKLSYPCKYSISARTPEELIGNQRTEDEICAILGATSLHYNTVDDFVKAIGLPIEKLCLACWLGNDH
jgi:amidophosphoribosyltransferase